MFLPLFYGKIIQTPMGNGVGLSEAVFKAGANSHHIFPDQGRGAVDYKIRETERLTESFALN